MLSRNISKLYILTCDMSRAQNDNFLFLDSYGILNVNFDGEVFCEGSGLYELLDL